MLQPNIIYKQIQEITSKLIEVSLSVEQNFPSNQNGVISYSGINDISIAMKNLAYEEVYKKLEETKNYNIKMIDGALIQLLYKYKNKELISHRLAFFPSPNLESFQNEPELYENDELYTDILAKNIVTFPIRFDYDPKNFKELEHPRTHVTFGQYKNCRIPVSNPLTPELFINFILRNFYNTAFIRYTDNFPVSHSYFNRTITDKEKGVFHLGIYQ
ncbi:DUF2290 domain-containing protein [Candidatus Venteria ishoeyi]|uniref:DUF2290 domain-containing protein n=1 Tax=Candidatus Venteria ishoeyi TaxID=1899563 RepID=A0A1H6F4D1_9GAMM|nr:DUF2290 domain-containing protein [Candidatus Venteria ishoeyi]MDM8548030.1 DUF2290 domain-containing protein [Candidatus Venteria ishoeyi]SEH04952.1 Uncharacterised protein [Candidatus Venteria ishoeyi]